MTISSFKLGLVAAVLAVSAGAANAQFIRGVDSTFTGVTAGTFDNSTATGTNWYLGNAAGSDGQLVTAGGVNNTAYLQINKNSSAAILLTPSTFTAISGNFDYLLSMQLNGASTKSATATWKLVSSTSESNAIGATALQGYLGGNHSTQVGLTGSWVTDNNAVTWESQSSAFSLLAGPNYTNVYLVLTASGASTSLGIDNVTAVPEPESYAMLLAGLGAIGFMSRRRKNLS